MQSFGELAEAFEQRLGKDMPFAAGPETLYDPCRYMMLLGGKRVRPVLCLMACELFSNINEDAWHAATAIELFHNFTLVHDDIMDNAPLRRGKTTLHEKYGLTSGILCGDVICIYAYQSLGKVERSLGKMMELFNRTAIEVCEGQQMDMDFEGRNNVTIGEYVEMITLKTSVLLACSLKMGALAGGALGDSARRLYEFGKNMGIAFQLQDDYLDAFGDVALLGKQQGGDIKANKKTYLLLKAMELADDSTKIDILSLLARTDEEKVPEMLDIYKNTGADKACREAVAFYSDLAFNALEELAVPAARRKPLWDLAAYLLHREK